MPILNLTNLTIRLAGEDDEVFITFGPERPLEIRSSGQELEVDGVPVEQTTITSVDGLPDPEDGTYYIVPQPVAFTSNRDDLLVPDTGPTAIRGEDGSVYAVHRLYSVTREEGQ